MQEKRNKLAGIAAVAGLGLLLYVLWDGWKSENRAPRFSPQATREIQKEMARVKNFEEALSNGLQEGGLVNFTKAGEMPKPRIYLGRKNGDYVFNSYGIETTLSEMRRQGYEVTVVHKQ